MAATDLTNMDDGSYANMRLGQFMVYSTALTATEVEQNFNAGRKRTVSKSYYHALHHGMGYTGQPQKYSSQYGSWLPTRQLMIFSR
jgi:hypothetical protein